MQIYKSKRIEGGQALKEGLSPWLHFHSEGFIFSHYGAEGNVEGFD